MGSNPTLALVALTGEAKREYQRNWVAERREQYFRDKRCVKCGSVEDLQLDHIDPAQKISHSIWSWSASRREVELAKCQVLCREHHKEKTIEQLPLSGIVPYQHGTNKTYRRGCRCELCRTWKRGENAKRKARGWM